MSSHRDIAVNTAMTSYREISQSIIKKVPWASCSEETLLKMHTVN